MFLQYFGLKFNPFSKEVPVEKMYMSQDLQELTQRLKYLQTTRGIGLVAGEPGAGKTTTLRKYASELNPSLYRHCYFSLSTVTVSEFYQGLALELGEEPAFKKVAIFRQIQQAICSMYYDNRITPVIILDEIHLASSKLLEDLRLIFNFKMDSQNPFILILSGQSTIRNKLGMNVNRPLKQRLAVKYVMQGLKKEEISDYCNSRLKQAGQVEDIITEGATEVLYANSNGLPRVVNSLMSNSLIYACNQNLRIIDEEVIYHAQNELNI
ncbi:AAA ATPase [Desulfofarcimen acetoxidans DSM 771]|uniref:AAA ATPase n=1 Tax=Desulfofarcimen acetoxidans (strain ATCC 49208 / DSM 771 / KCTC 5769 / VKM B-1644 / 5575) TaxID=485916 RepID=C8VXM2_DESAS|nr:AAA family ATPase [Desulfofarcimen acetoxidans]ACV62678.1 AAA ATPase [Desulfofarcimen acetoxidans DSM 771]